METSFSAVSGLQVTDIAMSSLHFVLFAVFLFAVEASVITPWESDVTKWPLDTLDEGDCQRDLKEYATALTRLNGTQDVWALQMLDSSAKLPNGILALNLVHIGVYHECLAVQHPKNQFQGKHCMLSMLVSPPQGAATLDRRITRFSQLITQQPVTDFQPIQPSNRQLFGTPMMLKYGMCIPSTCLAEDLNKILGNSKIRADDNNCATSEEKPLSDLAIVFISLCAVVSTLTLISTCYHYLNVYQNKKPTRLFCSFSLLQNVPKLLEIRSNDSDNMSCLHGIRTLSMMWVMLCHTYVLMPSYPITNLGALSTVMTDLAHAPITNGFFSVDSFFFLSGLLIAFVFFRNVSKEGGYDVLTGYIHRWIRLTPPFAMMVFATVALLPDSGSGPLWHDAISVQADACKDNWWSTLLYVQNYAKPEGQCLGQSWYLSADMQMFWIAPIILYPILLWPTYGTAFLGILIVASTLWTFAIDYTNEFTANMMLMKTFDQFQYDYIATHMRMTPWLVGMACGVAICAIKARKIQIRMTKWQALLGWCLNTALCLGIVFSIHRFQIDPDAPAVESALYLSFTRLGWGIGLSWVVFACIHGYGGVINSFLSLEVWQPLGKLSYCVYLTHMTLLTYKAASTQTNAYFTDLVAVNEFLATLVLSYLVSFVLYLTVEAPFVIMDQEILGSVRIFQYPRPKPKNTQLIEQEL